MLASVLVAGFALLPVVVVVGVVVFLAALVAVVDAARLVVHVIASPPAVLVPKMNAVEIEGIVQTVNVSRRHWTT